MNIYTYIYIYIWETWGNIEKKEVAVDLLERSSLHCTLEEVAIVCIRTVSEGRGELHTICII
jgi:hypothetical protein